MKFVYTHSAIILALFSFFLYLFTAAPFTLWLDAPRFVSAIMTMGVPNPPEPLYLILAKPFTYLPFGSPIFRIQVFSALSAALALVFIYRITTKLLEDINPASLFRQKSTQKAVIMAACFSTLMLAFSYQFWSQAQNVETFILVALIEVVVLYLSITAKNRKKFFINLCLIAGILGLATGTNPVLISIVPSLLWVMWHKRKFITAPFMFIWFGIGIVTTIAIHLYIPIASAANPFLNYWRATDIESIWHVSTGAGLNVYVPELGRVNGFTGSPEVFFKSTWHFIEMLLLKFTPLLLPFMVAGLYFLWKKSRYYFIFLGLIILTNWLFSSLYFSGNQESWFLVSDVAWVILAGLGFFWLVTDGLSLILPKLKLNKKYAKYGNLLLIFALLPLLFWFTTLNRRGMVITEDYINNLYKPIGEEKAIIFGSSDLFDSVSFYVHDVKGTSVYRPNTVPVTDNLLYIFKWYRDNLADAGLKIPDDSKLKYDSASEYSEYVSEFFRLNKDTHKIYITIPAMRNNFLQVYEGTPQEGLGGSLKLNEEEFKLVPQGMLFEVAEATSSAATNLENFNYRFSTKGFPKNKPKVLEQTYRSELTGLINEYAYSFENMGDESLKMGQTDNALKFYQQAFDLNPNNAEIISRLGNYYGNIGNHQKAAEYFEKALKIEPNNIGLLFNLSIAYENIGKVDKAIANLNKVLQLSKGNTQISQLAKTRLDALRGATPSAIASGSGSIQSQLLPQLPPGATLYQNKQFNIQFIVPKGFKVTEEKEGIALTNNLKGKDELTFLIWGRKIGEEDNIESLAENLPFAVEGIPLGSQPIAIPGFQAVGKTFGSGEHLTFLLLMKKVDQGWALRVYPGDSNKSNDFSLILSSIKTL